MFRRSRSRHAFSKNCLGILKTVVQIIGCAASPVIDRAGEDGKKVFKAMPVVLGLPRLAWVHHVPSMNRA